VLSLIGGLYNSLASVITIIVSTLTSVGLIFSVTKNLFFFPKDFKNQQLPSDRCARNFMEDNSPLNSEEKDKLVKEILVHRQSMLEAQENTKALDLGTLLSTYLPKPFFREKESRLLKQLTRKSTKALDLEFVVKQNKFNNSLNRAFLSQG